MENNWTQDLEEGNENVVIIPTVQYVNTNKVDSNGNTIVITPTCEINTFFFDAKYDQDSLDTKTKCEGYMLSNTADYENDINNVGHNSNADPTVDARGCSVKQRLKTCVPWLIIFMFVVVPAAVGFAFMHFRVKDLEAKVHKLTHAEFVGISLEGNTAKMTSRRTLPVRNWNVILKENISWDQRSKIVIKIPGIYYVYAQMFFKDNRVQSKEYMHFAIQKNYLYPLIAATVQVRDCNTTCTRHISEIVELKRHDRLSVRTYVEGITFRMSRDKSKFGAYLISETKETN